MRGVTNAKKNQTRVETFSDYALGGGLDWVFCIESSIACFTVSYKLRDSSLRRPVLWCIF